MLVRKHLLTKHLPALLDPKTQLIRLERTDQLIERVPPGAGERGSGGGGEEEEKGGHPPQGAAPFSRLRRSTPKNLQI